MAPQPPRRTTIAPINNAKNRRVTFAKRRNGIFKKAYELGVLCSCEIVVVIRDVRGRIHQFAAVFPEDPQAGLRSCSSDGSDDDQVSILLPREPTSIVPRAHTDECGRFLAKVVAGDAGPVAESRGPSFYDKGKPPMFVIGGDSNAGDEEDDEDEELGNVPETCDWRAHSAAAPVQQPSPSFGALLSTYTPSNVPAPLTSPQAAVSSRGLTRGKSTPAARSAGRKRVIPASASLSPPFSSRGAASQASTLNHPAFQLPPVPPFVLMHSIDSGSGYQSMQGEHNDNPFLSFSLSNDLSSASNPQSSVSSLSSLAMTNKSSVPGYPPSASTASSSATHNPFTLYPSPHISPVPVTTGESVNEPFTTQSSHHATSNPEPWHQQLAPWPLSMPPALPTTHGAFLSQHGGPPFDAAVTHFPLDSPMPSFHQMNALTEHMRGVAGSDELEPAGSQSSVEPSVGNEPFLSFLEQHFYPDKSPES